jgi:hypothetical protein
MHDGSRRGGGEGIGEASGGGNGEGISNSASEDVAAPAPSSITIQEKLQRLRVILSRQGGSFNGGEDNVAEQGGGGVIKGAEDGDAVSGEGRGTELATLKSLL